MERNIYTIVRSLACCSCMLLWLPPAGHAQSADQAAKWQQKASEWKSKEVQSTSDAKWEDKAVQWLEKEKQKEQELKQWRAQKRQQEAEVRAAAEQQRKQKEAELREYRAQKKQLAAQEKQQKKEEQQRLKAQRRSVPPAVGAPPAASPSKEARWQQKAAEWKAKAVKSAPEPQWEEKADQWLSEAQKKEQALKQWRAQVRRQKKAQRELDLAAARKKREEMRAWRAEVREKKRLRAMYLRDEAQLRKIRYQHDVLEEKQHEATHASILGFNVGGNLTALLGWQKMDASALNVGNAPRGLLGDQLANVTVVANADTMALFIDQAEIDVYRDLSDRTSLRFDLDIAPQRDTNRDGDNKDVADVIDLEQAYLEGCPAAWCRMAAGRFNAGVGLDPVDRADLHTISFSSLHRFLLPHNVTGLRASLLNHLARWDVFVVQGINNQDINAKTAVPSFGTNLRLVWGDPERASWLKVSGLAGPQSAASTPWTFVGDLAADFYLAYHFRLGLEGIYRQENGGVCGEGRADCRYFGGVLQMRFPFNDTVSVTTRGGYLLDKDNGPRTGSVQSIIDATGAVNVQVAKHAKITAEYRLELARPMGSIAARQQTLTHGVGTLVSYSF